MENLKLSAQSNLTDLPPGLLEQFYNIGFTEQQLESLLEEQDHEEEMAMLMAKWKAIVIEICGTYPPPAI